MGRAEPPRPLAGSRFEPGLIPGWKSGAAGDPRPHRPSCSHGTPEGRSQNPPGKSPGPSRAPTGDPAAGQRETNPAQAGQAGQAGQRGQLPPPGKAGGRSRPVPAQGPPWVPARAPRREPGGPAPGGDGGSTRCLRGLELQAAPTGQRPVPPLPHRSLPARGEGRKRPRFCPAFPGFPRFPRPAPARHPEAARGGRETASPPVPVRRLRPPRAETVRAATGAAPEEIGRAHV